MARPEGFEPPTEEVEAPCSIQLSYGRALRRRLARIVRAWNLDHNALMEIGTDAVRGLEPVDANAVGGAQFRYFDFVMAAFVTILLLSNVIGAGKRAVIDLPVIGPWPFGAGILFFPVSYVLGDVLTEVYGYARARRCIWAGFAAMLFMAVHELRWSSRCRPTAGWTRAGGVRGGIRAGAADRVRLDVRFLGRVSSPTAWCWRG